MEACYHLGRLEQKDFPQGAIEFRSTNPEECFQLGIMFADMCRMKIEVTTGEWGDGRNIRLPVTLEEIGREEEEEIAPAVKAACESGLDVVGPYPADSVFYRAVKGEFDAVMALYHDQGHIAIKMHNFEDSITATMGIPFIRTSVDHGTAFDIAGQNKANADGLGKALNAAIDMLNGTLS